jgi:hypothetical protein
LLTCFENTSGALQALVVSARTGELMPEALAQLGIAAALRVQFRTTGDEDEHDEK